jgi:hypothetical protein
MLSNERLVAMSGYGSRHRAQVVSWERIIYL